MNGTGNEPIDEDYDKFIQDSIDIQNFFMELISSDDDLENSDLLKFFEADDKLKFFNILESFNYASFWCPSKISRVEKIFDFIFANIKNKLILSNEQLKYEIFTSKILNKKIVELLSPTDQQKVNINHQEKNKSNEYDDKKIFEIIQKDDFSEFQDMVSQYDIDLDGSISIPNDFEYKELFGNYLQPVWHEEYNDSQDDDFQDEMFDSKRSIHKSIYKGKFIEIAAFFGSINIFKFLWMNKANFDKNIIKYLIIGGNYEIIHLVEDYISYSPDDLNIAIKFHQNSIFDYIINNNDFEVNRYNLKIAVQSNNLEFLVNNIDYLKDSFTIDEIIRYLTKSIKNKNVLIFIILFTRCYDKLKESPSFSLNLFLKQAISEKSFEIVQFLTVKNKEFLTNVLESNDLIKGTSEIMKYCLSLFDEKNFVIDSNLMCKASANSVVEVVEFIDKKCEMFENVSFSDDETPFHCACLAGNYNVIKYLAENHKEWIEMKDKNGISPIHNAVLSSELKAVKYLIIKLNVDVNVVDNENRTPLYYAVENDFVEIVIFLCSLKNVNINIKTLTGNTPLELAINKNNADIVDVLKRKGGIQNILSNI